MNEDLRTRKVAVGYPFVAFATFCKISLFLFCRMVGAACGRGRAPYLSLFTFHLSPTSVRYPTV